jgi:hypothetical protein
MKYCLTDTKGARISDIKYDYLATCNKDTYIFNMDGRLIAVDRNGKVVHEFPYDITGLFWLPAAQMYKYSSGNHKTKIGGYDYMLEGLMDADFNVVAEPAWRYIYQSPGGTVICASYVEQNTDNYFNNTLIDKKGNKIIYDEYTDFRGSSIFESRFNETDSNIKSIKNEYFITSKQFNKYENANNANDLIDQTGKILFTDTERLQLDNVYREYVGFRYIGPGKDNDEYKVGLKSADNRTGLADADINGDSWILPPIYSYISVYLPCKYIFASQFNQPGAAPDDEYNEAVFDIMSGKIMFKGNYTGLRYYGYKFAGRGSGDLIDADTEGIFYAETSTRKGYLNSGGEWIVSVSKFDTLGAGD